MYFYEKNVKNSFLLIYERQIYFLIFCQKNQIHHNKQQKSGKNYEGKFRIKQKNVICRTGALVGLPSHNFFFYLQFFFYLKYFGKNKNFSIHSKDFSKASEASLIFIAAFFWIFPKRQNLFSFRIFGSLKKKNYENN